jgi:histidinol-phosphate aminotransferase
MEKNQLNLPQPRSEIESLQLVHHGALDFTEIDLLGLNPDDVLDFSVNCNPFGPSPAVHQAILQVALDRYPDRDAITLRKALAARLGVGMGQIVVGNGTSELLSLVALAYVRPADRVLILTPTYSEYSRSAALMSANVQSIFAGVDQNFLHNPDVISRRITAQKYQIVFICNPNNPTGVVIPTDLIAAWVQASPQTLFVVDEAYLQFVPGLISALSLAAPNLLVLTSMTKDYALAGLRLGYAVGHPDMIAVVEKVRPPWNVNALALAAEGVFSRDRSPRLSDNPFKNALLPGPCRGWNQISD